MLNIMNAEDDRADRKYSKDTLRQQEEKKIFFFGHMTPPRTPKIGDHFSKRAIFDILGCFSINKMDFLATNVGFRLFLVLEQPKISCFKPKISQVALHDLRAFNLNCSSVQLQYMLGLTLGFRALPVDR